MKKYFKDFLQTIALLMIISTVWISGLNIGPGILQNFTDYFIYFYTVLIIVVTFIRFNQYFKFKLMVQFNESKTIIEKLNNFLPFLFPLSAILFEWYVIGTISGLAMSLIKIIYSAGYVENSEIENHLEREKNV